MEHLVWKCVFLCREGPLYEAECSVRGESISPWQPLHTKVRPWPDVLACPRTGTLREPEQRITQPLAQIKIRSMYILLYIHSTQSCSSSRLSPQIPFSSGFVEYHCGHIYYMHALIWFFLSVHGNQTSSVLILSLFLKLICQYLPQMWTDATYYTSLSVLAELFTR